jgi:hypothetical protein
MQEFLDWREQSLNFSLDAWLEYYKKNSKMLSIPVDYYKYKIMNNSARVQNEFGIYLNPKTQSLLGKYLVFDSNSKAQNSNAHTAWRVGFDINSLYLIESGLGCSFTNLEGVSVEMNTEYIKNNILNLNLKFLE